MRLIKFSQAVLLLAALAPVLAIGFSASGQNELSTSSEGTLPPTSRGATVPKKRTNKSAQSAPWHHFGEPEGASLPAPSPSGDWRHFGPRANASNAVPSEIASRPIPSGNRLAAMERQLWVMVNHDRLDPANALETKGGHAQPLRWNERLAEVARAHSRDMMDQNFFDHVDPHGKTPEARIDAAGIPWRAMGENIATNGKGAGDAEAAFMNEPRYQHNHRANILNTDYTEVGIGIVQDRRGRYYITQDFVGNPSVPEGK